MGTVLPFVLPTREQYETFSYEIKQATYIAVLRAGLRGDTNTKFHVSRTLKMMREVASYTKEDAFGLEVKARLLEKKDKR